MKPEPDPKQVAFEK
jgi:peptidoglycan/LPS O-acetylase OafA/YrhL